MDQGGTGGIKYMLAARMLGIPVYYIGIGVDAHKKLKTKISLMLAAAISKGIYARDRFSMRVFENYSIFSSRKRVDLIPDLAFGMHDIESQNVPAGPSNDGQISVCLRDLSGYVKSTEATINSILLIALTVLKELELNNVSILIGDAEVDLGVSNMAEYFFKSKGFSCQVVDGAHVHNAITSIAQSKYVLTVRLHPAVVAHSLGVPYGLFNYSDKNSKFLEQVDESERAIYEGCEAGFIPSMAVPKVKGRAVEYGKVVEKILTMLN
jgi:polysaccharide pyruvyl transferase WcaK-like protein